MIHAIVTPYRFVPAIDPEYCARDYDWEWWFKHETPVTRFKTELLSFQLYLRPAPGLHVEFTASTLTEQELALSGLEGGSFAGYYPYLYEEHVLGIDRTLGPDVILGAREQWEGAFDKLRVQIANVEPGIWQFIWSSFVQARSGKVTWAV